MIDMRDAFFETLFVHIKNDNRYVVISSDYEPYSYNQYKSSINYINGGVSEQNIINVAAGMSYKGKRVIVLSISPFILLRAFEQIKLNINCMNFPINIVGIGQGVASSFDGPSHHCVDDCSLIKNLNANILTPCNMSTAKECVSFLVNSKIFNYICIGKQCSEEFDVQNGYVLLSVEDDKLVNSDDYKNIVVITTGSIIENVIKSIRKYKLNNKVSILYILHNYPMPEILIPDISKLVVQESNIIGSMFTDIKIKTNLHFLGYENSDIRQYGSVNFIRSYYKLDVNSLANKMLELINA